MLPLLAILATCAAGATLSPARTFSGHSNWVFASAFSPANSSEFLTASSDNTIIVWNKAGSITRIITGHSAPVRALAINPSNASEFVTSSYDGTLRLFNKHTGTTDRVFTGPTSSVVALAFNPSNTSEFVSCGADGVIVWHKGTGLLVWPGSKGPL
eukprot:TRINITY_DN21605_c0_g1_i2.p2 TRINITY_DN21605_c0_g1~~TRINITY_DN21605_c0_g1_i2.p2  ORF type:complete len:156 (-),score=17.78 TRINITY_DN21605_c0_g1_i2:5-472(-)